MKTALFIGPYRQQDRWGINAKDYIKAILMNKNIRLACRPIYYTSFTNNIVEEEIVACESSSYPQYDVLLQYGFPLSFNHNSVMKKNIGILNIEFSEGKSVDNLLNLEKLDEIYVSTPSEKKALLSMGVNTSISVIPQPFDLNIVTENISIPPIKINPIIDSTFKFYCRCDTESRKNLELIIKAFHIAFKELDKVSLLIAPDTRSNLNQVRSSITELSKNIKYSLRINKIFKNEVILMDMIDNQKNMILHNTGNCYINLTSGTNYDIETIIAMYLGKTPMVMQHTGLADLVGGDNGGFIVKSDNTPILLKDPPLPDSYDLFNSNYMWKSPNIESLIETFKKIYSMYKNDKKTYMKKQQFAVDKINQYSYQSIGEKICL